MFSEFNRLYVQNVWLAYMQTVSNQSQNKYEHNNIHIYLSVTATTHPHTHTHTHTHTNTHTHTLRSVQPQTLERAEEKIDKLI